MGMLIGSRRALLGGGRFKVTDVPQSEGDALIWLYEHTNGPNWTNHTNWLQTHTVGNWFGVTVAGGHVTAVNLSNNNLIGNIGGFPVHSFPSLGTCQLYTNAGLTGNIGGWTWSDPTTHIRFDNTGVSGDVSGWAVPVVTTHLYLFASSLSGAPNLGINTAMREYYYHDCGLVQANVDAVLLSVYTRRMTFAWAAPGLTVGGTNAAPSGVYQAACPPTTGKEYAFELVNDSCLDGFNKWIVTFTP